MERRDIPTYNPESPPVKLPLAAIVSTPADRRALPTRRGSSIFSPTQTQTLDHHHHHLLPQLHHRHSLTPPPPPPPPPPHVLVKDLSPDPDPSTPTPDNPSNSRTPPSPPQPQLQPPPPPPAEGGQHNNSSGSVIRYRECLKNHAASMGGHIVDGCGEFMPNGDDGTAESLRCAACDCHRNFHRKEVDGEAQPSNFHHSSNRTALRSNQAPPLLAAAHQQQGFSAAAAGMVHFGGGGGAGDESSSEDLNMYQSSGGGGGGMRRSGSKKRFRTKFSQEQKDRMQELAEKMEWRIQKQDEQLVQKLCEETGVKRQVFKVWMHNNKQAMKKKHIQI